jgi:hypothetical protein
MADEAPIRLENFKRLYPADSWSGADLCQKFGRTPSFWSDLRAGRKSFGEKLARSLEDADELVAGSLDVPLGAKKMPLSRDVLDHLKSLPRDRQHDADKMLRLFLGLPETSGKRAGNDA